MHSTRLLCRLCTSLHQISFSSVQDLTPPQVWTCKFKAFFRSVVWSAKGVVLIFALFLPLSNICRGSHWRESSVTGCLWTHDAHVKVVGRGQDCVGIGGWIQSGIDRCLGTRLHQGPTQRPYPCSRKHHPQPRLHSNDSRGSGSSVAVLEEHYSHVYRSHRRYNTLTGCDTCSSMFILVTSYMVFNTCFVFVVSCRKTRRLECGRVVKGPGSVQIGLLVQGAPHAQIAPL